MNFIRKIFLEKLVFICGLIVMAFEIIASRILGPFVGTSITVWTSIIGIILLSLSLGYVIGGRMADNKPQHSRLALIVIFAGILLMLVTTVKNYIIGGFVELSDNLYVVSVFSSLLLLAPPSILLGMVSPFAARLRINDLQSSGATVGYLYAISTLGSIAGTLLAGFVLIPFFGTTAILYTFSATLILFGFLQLIIYRTQNSNNA